MRGLGVVDVEAGTVVFDGKLPGSEGFAEAEPSSAHPPVVVGVPQRLLGHPVHGHHRVTRQLRRSRRDVEGHAEPIGAP